MAGEPEAVAAVPPPERLINREALARAAPDFDLLPAVLHEQLEAAADRLDQALADGVPIAELVAARAGVVNELVRCVWQRALARAEGLALLAVGGFGRGELHPYSDVDLLTVYEDGAAPPREVLESFVGALWDSGLILGHSMRSLSECVEDAEADVEFATNLMEARTLGGDDALSERLIAATAPPAVWPAERFFAAKLEEQQVRHEGFHDTAYNLEPNIKEGPGGLRDIQTVGWVARRHFGDADMATLASHGLLMVEEYRALVAGRDLLWRIRWALHRLAGRAEERLLFEHQRRLAADFGYRDCGEDNLAVEQFMQRYYRTVTRLERLNERILQQYREELLPAAPERVTEPLDDDFRIHSGYLEARDPALFRQDRHALMRLFLCLQQHRQIQGVRAGTIRAFRRGLRHHTDALPGDDRALALFLRILRQPEGVYAQLARMNRYGLLAVLIPEFGGVVGRMQFDLFHVYTVDQHTLFVVRNLRRFARPGSSTSQSTATPPSRASAPSRDARVMNDPGDQYREQFHHAVEVFARADQPELLYLAALFHDIAKGRGGDHSELGGRDADVFCRRLGLDAGDRRLVVWLVRHHLLLSSTAQRRDISDPEVINEFAASVGDQRRLDYLYLLTVADIAATSPRLWTSWKDSLLWKLYLGAGHALRRGLDKPVGRKLVVRETRAEALSRLLAAGVERRAIGSLWRRLPSHAFLRLSVDQLEWMTAAAIAHGEPHTPGLACRNLEPQGISELFVWCRDYDGLFATATSVLDEMRCDVLAARVLTTSDGVGFDLFQVVDANGGPLNRSDTRRLLEFLRVPLGQQRVPVPRRARVPRRLREFLAPARIEFSDGDATGMRLECTDRPGLLSQIATVFVDQGIRVHDARIATFGDRVEDAFLLADRDEQLLDAEARVALEQALRERLDAPLGEHGGTQSGNP